MKKNVFNQIHSLYCHKTMNMLFKYANKEIGFREELKSSITIKLKQLLHDIECSATKSERAKLCLSLFREINKYQDDFMMILHYYRSFIYLFITIKYKISELMNQYYSGGLKDINARLMKSLIMEFAITETFIENILTHYIHNYGNIRETRNNTYVYHNGSGLCYIKKRDKKTGHWVNYEPKPMYTYWYQYK